MNHLQLSTCAVFSRIFQYCTVIVNQLNVIMDDYACIICFVAFDEEVGARLG